MNINPNDPANPMVNISYENNLDHKEGLTIRQEFAARAMQGLLSGSLIHYSNGYLIAELSVKIANALIEELNKTDTNGQ